MNLNNDKYEKWLVVIGEQEKSGLSQREFCEKNSIVLSAFSYYKSVLKDEGKKPDKSIPEFKPVKVGDKENIKTPSSDIRITIPNGFQLTFPCHLEVVKIKQLMEVLLRC